MVHSPENSVKELAILTSLAGLLYCAWPLGFFLNPLANKGLASNLQGSGQPYNWLFIILDILCGTIIVYVASRLYKFVGSHNWLSYKTITVLSFGLFGLLTALDAILPVDCAADQNRCGALINHPLVIIHGLVSIGSIGALAISVLAGWLLLRSRKQWTALLKPFSTFIVGSYFFFGIVTALLIVLDQSSALSQHIFIVICSLWIGTVPFIIFSDSQKNRHPKVRSVKSPQNL